MNKVKISMRRMRAEKKKYNNCVWLELKQESKRHLSEYMTENRKFCEKIAQNEAHVLV